MREREMVRSSELRHSQENTFNAQPIGDRQEGIHYDVMGGWMSTYHQQLRARVARVCAGVWVALRPPNRPPARPALPDDFIYCQLLSIALSYTHTHANTLTRLVGAFLVAHRRPLTVFRYTAICSHLAKPPPKHGIPADRTV